jgi:hypothetical protein
VRLSAIHASDVTRYSFTSKGTRFDAGGGAWGFSQTLFAARIGSSRWLQGVFAVTGAEHEELSTSP